MADLLESHFRIQHLGCPFTELSGKHPQGTLVQWCNGKTDVLEVKSKEEQDLRRLVSDVAQVTRKAGGTTAKTERFGNGGFGLVLHTKGGMCACRRALRGLSVLDTIRKSRSVDVPPTVYKDGWEYHTVLSFQPKDFKRLFRDLNSCGLVEITSKKIYDGPMQDSFAISLHNLFSDLTRKQLDSFIDALDLGYYEVPRTTTLAQIAKRRDVPRTTMNEHLRKAESKIALAIAPYVRIYGAMQN